MAEQSPESTPRMEAVEATPIVTETTALIQPSDQTPSAQSTPEITVSNFDEAALLRRPRSLSRKKTKKKKKSPKPAKITNSDSGSESDTEDEKEVEESSSSSSSTSSESEVEPEKPLPQEKPVKQTRFDVPKKSKKDKKKDKSTPPRSSVDVASLRNVPRSSMDYFADIRNPPRYSVDLRRSEDRHRYSEVSGDSFMRRRSFGTRGTALTVEPLDDPFAERREMPALFGIRPSWSGRESMDGRRLTQQLDESLRSPHPVHQSNLLVMVGNFIYAALFGWVIAAAYMIAAALLWVSQVGKPYAHLCRRLAGYYLWPFGKYLTRPAGYGAMTQSKKDDDIMTESTSLFVSQSKRSAVMTEEHGYEIEDDIHYETSTPAWIIWCIVASFLTVIHAVIAFICWIIVVSIPMSKVHQVGIRMAWHDPLAVRITSSAKMDGEIELSTEQAFSFSYISYEALGVNVVLLNMTPCILIVVLFELVIPHHYHPPSVIFAVMCLFAIVPLAYIIGTAVGSIALQTNFTVGAMLNAIFGVSIEIILYSSAIRRGGLETLVQAGVTGSVLGDLLLIPGLSMLAGGIKYKEQRFSPAVAGVSSVLLVISVIGAFTPTIVWLVYGEYHFTCATCTFANGTEACQNCDFIRVTDYDSSPVYIHAVRPLMYACSIILPFAYLVGLLFTLKTHSYIFENVEPDEQDAPRWSIMKSSVVLGCSIALFAIVSEGLVAVMEPALHDLGINQTFAGLTLMALVPSSAEYVNAIQFALNNQIALSMEIGASSAVQICLIMMPILVGFSAFVNHLNSANSFILVFPLFSVFAIIMSVIIVNYISIEGVTNYFKGASLTIIYLLFVAAFFFSQHVTV